MPVNVCRYRDREDPITEHIYEQIVMSLDHLRYKNSIPSSPTTSASSMEPRKYFELLELEYLDIKILFELCWGPVKVDRGPKQACLFAISKCVDSLQNFQVKYAKYDTGLRNQESLT